MSKSIGKKAAALSLSALLCLGNAAPLYAAQADRIKDENVYVSLADNGSVSGLYVINEYTSKEAGEVTDYGDYSSVKNLTTEESIQTADGKQTMTVSKGKYYYQGNLEEAELPWNIAVSYHLDGTALAASDLAGKSGSLKIKIKITENKKCEKDFFDNYLLQATVVLDTEKCTDIKADGATEGNVGRDRQLLYNIMSGQEKTITITAEVENFEMDGLTFKAVPMGFDIDSDTLDTSEIKKKTAEIKDGVVDLDDGADELNEASETAADGAGTLADGTSSLLSGGKALLSGAGSLEKGGDALYTGIKKVDSGVRQYTNGTDELTAGMKKYVKGVDSLAAGSESLESGLATLEKQVNALSKSASADQLKQLTAALAKAKETASSCADGAKQMSTVLEQSASLGEAVEASHKAVLSGLQSQVDAANKTLKSSSETLASKVNASIDEKNEELSSAATTTNSALDEAAAAIEAAKKDGSIDEETANKSLEKIKAAKVEKESLSHVDAPEITVEITMPAEDAGVQQAIAGLTKSATAASGAADTFSQAASGFSQIAAAIPSSVSTDSLGQLSAALAKARKGAGQLNDGFEKLQKNESALLEGASSLQTAGKTLKKGTRSLLSGSRSLNSGITSLTNGIVTLNNGIAKVDTGAGELASGLSELADGTGELADGTEEFRDKTKDIDQKIDDEIEDTLDKISGSDYEPVSFTSDKNKDIGLVQFAMTTDAIEVPEAEESETVEEKTTLLDKIKDLF